jgi:hypothetical protein
VSTKGYPLEKASLPEQRLRIRHGETSRKKLAEFNPSVFVKL